MCRGIVRPWENVGKVRRVKTNERQDEKCTESEIVCWAYCVCMYIHTTSTSASKSKVQNFFNEK